MGLQCGKNRRLATFFANDQNEIAFELAKISTMVPRWRVSFEAAEKSGNLDAYVAEEFQVYPQYLGKAFYSGDGLWLDLYAGEKLKQGFATDGNFNEAAIRIGAVVDEEIDYLTEVAKQKGLNGELEDLKDALSSVRSVIHVKNSRPLNILWIADCLYLDIQSFLGAPLASKTLCLHTDLVTTKNPIERYEQTMSLVQSGSYDAIFYCPFSYENSSGYAQLFDAKRAILNFFKATLLANEEFPTIESMASMLCEKSECPIFIHNASGVARHLGTWKDFAKDLMTRAARMSFCRAINSRLQDLCRRLNAERPVSRMIVLDEFAVVSRVGLRSSGAYFHQCGLQHPAKLGLFLTETYLDALVAMDTMLKKKVVVCDLDYTLWDGMVGEGAVEHHIDRQLILKSLKKKGVLLAINSKNDVANLKWDGAALNGDDFAGLRVNWNTKAENIGELVEEMNLNASSFVFVDDRADERAMVSSAYPEITTLDANDVATWRRLAVWEEMLSGVGVADRTQMYQKRLEREKFVSSGPKLTKESLFAQLELKCIVELAEKRDIPRVAELLNRTNQFNTTGRRTSLKEVESWREDPARWIYVAKASDRFGDMGLVSILVAHEKAQEIEIEAFVLSCRVFGYGIETALLKVLIDSNPDLTVSGVIIPTAVNQPCQSVYATHNFCRSGDRWSFGRGSVPMVNKGWLKVENRCTTMSLHRMRLSDRRDLLEH